MFAVLGTVVSTFVVGMFCYTLAIAGLVSLDTESPLQSLLFGALISAGMFLSTCMEHAPARARD